MRVGHLQPTRPEWYDRRPEPIGKLGATAGPASLAVRWSYTVPAGKKSYLDYCTVSAHRSAVATNAGTVNAYVILKDAAAVQIAQLCYVELRDNVPGASDRSEIGAYGVLTAGMVAEGWSADSSTGGATLMLVQSKFTEFDA